MTPEPNAAGTLGTGAQDAASPAGEVARGRLPWRDVAAGPLIGIVAMAAALVTTHAAGVPLRDPDHVVGRRLIGVVVLVAALVALDVLVRAGLRTGRRRPPWSEIVALRRERWTLYRALVAGGGLLGFYASYLAYRNLKSVLPLLRPGDLFDHQIASIDRAVFLGHDPGVALHGLLGTGWVQTQLLSSVYVFYVLFVPLLVGLALVFAPSLRHSLFLVAAMSLNWALGAASYFMLPTLGPVYAKPRDFAGLPTSAASDLQDLLARQRNDFLADPHVAGRAQDIAAFASLHVSMLFTIALAASLLGLARGVRIGLWVFMGVSALSTLYLGWHYAVDDVAGAAIGVAALALAWALTGFDPRPQRHPA